MPKLYRMKKRPARKYNTFRGTDYKLYKQVSQIINRKIEKKFVDGAADNQAVGYDAPVVVRLSGTVQGTSDASQRIGDEVELAGFHINFIPHADTVSTVFRMIVFQWKDDDASGVPTAAAVLSSGATNVGYMSPYNHDNGAQYTILCDKLVACTPGQGNERVVRQCTLNLTKKHRNFERKIHYNNAGQTGKNNLYLLIISRNVVASGDNVDWYCRTTYRDA